VVCRWDEDIAMKSKATLFGRLLRKLRIDRGVVLKDMADGVQISTAYASAVELGNKNITEQFVQKISTYFRLNAEEIKELQDAVDVSQPSLKIDLKMGDDEDRELAVSFARKYHDLSSERKQKLMKLLEG